MTDMKLTQRNMGDGIRLWILPKDTFKTDYLVVRFLMPLTRETAASYALLPSVLCRGCEAYPNLEALAEQLDNLYNAGVGGRSRRRGDCHVVNFYVRSLERGCIPDGEDVFAETTETLGEVLLHPLTENGGFLPAYVEGEKKNLIDAIHARINNKSAYAVSRCEEEMCKGEPFSISETGYEEDASKITPQSLYACYETMLSEAPMELFYVGQRPENEVEAIVRAFLAPLLPMRRTLLTVPSYPARRKAEGDIRYVNEDQPVRQGKLSIGFRSGRLLSDGDFYAFALFNELLGGSASSKLFLQVREAMGLCYYIQSVPEALKGLYLITCGIDPENREAAEQAIFAQIEAVQRGDFTDAELEDARKSLISGYRELEDSAGGLAEWYFNRMLAGIATSPEETAEQVRQTSREEVIRAAQGISPDTVYFMNGTASGSAGDEDGEEELDD